MAYNQYYPGQDNYMAMPNQPYYQPNVMTPGAHTPRITPPTPMNQLPQTNSMVQMPQMNHIPQMNQMPQMNPVPQVNTSPQLNQIPPPNAQFQYTNNAAMNYLAPVTPMAPDPRSSNQYDLQNGMMNQVPPNTSSQNYTTSPQYPVMQPNQTSGSYPSSNAYNSNNQVGYNNMVLPQTSNASGMLTNTAYTDQQQYGIPMSQQMSYSTTGNGQQMTKVPNTQTQPIYGGEPCNPQSQQNQPQSTGASKEEQNSTFKPTNVIGHYKCSDFPTLYSGKYRYNDTPTQRKPFTMKGESLKPHNSSDRRTNIGLNKFGKRWELRGGKYYGCFTSRTNGLQDICPKAKCRLCPNDNKKK